MLPRLLMILIPLALVVYAFVDCVTADERNVRHLPKPVWAACVLLLPVVGAVAWLTAGGRRGGERGRGAGRPVWVAPDDNPEFLRSLDEAAKTARDGEAAEREATGREATGREGERSGRAQDGPEETPPSG
ncbi:PLD nuclease N-terminal domain-containing protein [Streptomyces sp. B1866]|uniref:PLD nuclease N-terminal domain-containing protein n=1 Tax=Streptomyces sp. B1866 TaxID=3075431 RepID=UPI00288F7599|nr:PLD nuclease N-terminal domain-containing protein [Streptomyces sp. B1866]MDT3396091.1 PLD nuclease N-terminal domain-containing protein [Streptomyces sp. B1866]